MSGQRSTRVLMCLELLKNDLKNKKIDKVKYNKLTKEFNNCKVLNSMSQDAQRIVKRTYNRTYNKSTKAKAKVKSSSSSSSSLSSSSSSSIIVKSKSKPQSKSKSQPQPKSKSKTNLRAQQVLNKMQYIPSSSSSYEDELEDDEDTYVY